MAAILSAQGKHAQAELLLRKALAVRQKLLGEEHPVTATALLMTRFYQNLLGKREGLTKPLPKAEALSEAKRWLRSLTPEQVERLQAQLPARRRGSEENRPPEAPVDGPHPVAHPYYWSAFILIGDPN